MTALVDMLGWSAEAMIVVTLKASDNSPVLELKCSERKNLHFRVYVLSSRIHNQIDGHKSGCSH